MKNIYEAPKLDIVVFSTKDVITTSGAFDGEDDTWSVPQPTGLF